MSNEKFNHRDLIKALFVFSITALFILLNAEKLKAESFDKILNSPDEYRVQIVELDETPDGQAEMIVAEHINCGTAGCLYRVLRRNPDGTAKELLAVGGYAREIEAVAKYTNGLKDIYVHQDRFRFNGVEYELHVPGKPFKSVNVELVKVQEALGGLGLYAGKNDGLSGSKTQRAIRLFQALMNEQPNGRLNSKQKKLLTDIYRDAYKHPIPSKEKAIKLALKENANLEYRSHEKELLKREKILLYGRLRQLGYNVKGANIRSPDISLPLRAAAATFLRDKGYDPKKVTLRMAVLLLSFRQSQVYKNSKPDQFSQTLQPVISNNYEIIDKPIEFAAKENNDLSKIEPATGEDGIIDKIEQQRLKAVEHIHHKIYLEWHSIIKMLESSLNETTLRKIKDTNLIEDFMYSTLPFVGCAQDNTSVVGYFNLAQGGWLFVWVDNNLNIKHIQFSPTLSSNSSNRIGNAWFDLYNDNTSIFSAMRQSYNEQSKVFRDFFPSNNCVTSKQIADLPDGNEFVSSIYEDLISRNKMDSKLLFEINFLTAKSQKIKNKGDIVLASALPKVLGIDLLTIHVHRDYAGAMVIQTWQIKNDIPKLLNSGFELIEIGE